MAGAANAAIGDDAVSAQRLTETTEVSLRKIGQFALR
jgi:hypothetical protein